MKETAGTLLFRRGKRGLEVLVVDAGKRIFWSIPKGGIEPGENAEATARRETREETCLEAPRSLVPIGYVIYKKERKRLHCYVGEVRGSVRIRPSQEIVAARFVPVAVARRLLEPPQRTFLDWLTAGSNSHAA